MDTEHRLSRTFLETHPGDAAVVLERLGPDTAAPLLAELPPQIAAAVIERTDPAAGAECLGRMAPARAAAVTAALPLDTAALLLRRLDPPAQGPLLEALPGRLATPLDLLLRYPEGTAGALMDPRALALPHDIPVGEALARARRAARHVLYYLYIVDRQHTLVGVVNLRELMLAPRKAPLAAVMRPHVARLSARADRGVIVAHAGWRDFHTLPVVDDRGAFLGALRYETLRRLEDDGAAQRASQHPLTTVLTLGELCWSGLTLVFGDLADAIAAQSAPRPPGGRDTHGP